MSINSLSESKCPLGSDRKIVTVISDSYPPVPIGGEVDLGFGIVKIQFNENILCPVDADRIDRLHLDYVLQLRVGQDISVTENHVLGVELANFTCLFSGTNIFTNTIQFVLTENERTDLISSKGSNQVYAAFAGSIVEDFNNNIDTNSLLIHLSEIEDIKPPCIKSVIVDSGTNDITILFDEKIQRLNDVTPTAGGSVTSHDIGISIIPETNPENVKILVDFVKDFR